MDFFTSDTHFNHAKIIRYCKRPFLKDPDVGYDLDSNLDVEAMDATLISKWNQVVKPGDHVYHLGDFAMGPNLRTRVTEIRKQLHGSITLVRGNHDRPIGFYLNCGFEKVFDTLDTTVEGKHIYMKHRPAKDLSHPKWKPYSIILVGHVHERWKRDGKMVNVGADQWNFTPVKLEDLLKA